MLVLKGYPNVRGLFMKTLLAAMNALVVLFSGISLAWATELVHHNLTVKIYPAEHQLWVHDAVTVPDSLLPAFRFMLHKGLDALSLPPGMSLVHKGKPKETLSESFRAKLPAGTETFMITYQGKIYHPLRLYGQEHARGFRRTPGIISAEGVYLAGSSLWYPTFDESFVDFTLQVALPPNWDAVSQGERILHIHDEKGTIVRWVSTKPNEEIHIIAAPFTEYTRQAGETMVMAFLRTPDDGLANHYLDMTTRYIGMYENLIGPYPFEKFALVENFWETGFGMASFTLLGTKVMHFPFIMYSSYPHEILHNWWGNSVFPDMERGNWSEGLTAYLADHLIKEMSGQGVEYRRQSLQKYADHVLKERDFALTAFRSRHSSASEAVGYGKCLMVFHMLRQTLGDEAFTRGLRQLYKQYQFRLASFEDLQKIFEGASGKALQDFFCQWVTRPGAPQLQVSRARPSPDKDGYVLHVTLKQIQPPPFYLLHVPVAVTMEGEPKAFQTVVAMDKPHLTVPLHLPARPLRLDVDPEFDLFRKLGRDETPPALTQTLGSKRLLIVLPSQVSEDLLNGYQGLARTFQESGPDEVDVRLDRDIQTLPCDRAVALFGRENRFAVQMRHVLSGYGVKVGRDRIEIQQNTFPKQNHAFVVTARQPKNPDSPLTWVACDLPGAFEGLGRKLPHYQKYSYLVFKGQKPVNIAKGRWPVLDSSMTVFFPDARTVAKVKRARLKPRKALATWTLPLQPPRQSLSKP